MGMYSKTKAGGFNMLKLRDFFDAIKINWIKRYVDGIDDHWADLLDQKLNLNINNRHYLLFLGAENPKINSIIKKDLPGISRFFISLKRLITAFYSNKEAADNRWINANVLFNPNFLIPDWETRELKGKQNANATKMLIPEDIGLKTSDEHTITLKSLFISNKFVTKSEFGARFTPINFIYYLKLKKEVLQYCINNKGFKIEIVEQETLPYVSSTLTELIQVNQKGSKRFRDVLTINGKKEIKLSKESWKKTLNTTRMCESEIRMGYQSMQTKEFSRQILDFKARLLLRKTQFPNMIHKWKSEVSQYCQACLDKGDQQIADFKHILFECPTRLCII